MTVLEVGVRPHTCAPGWESRWSEGSSGGPFPSPPGNYYHQLDLPAGSVWQCECGAVWIARAMKPHENRGLIMHRIHWRRETRRQQRRRLRS